MDYKQDKWYNVARIVFIASVISAAIAMALMGFGIDFAILWFFVDCIPLALSSVVMANIKYKYQTYNVGDYTAKDRVSDFLEDFKNFFLRKGVVGSIVFVVLMVSVVCSLLQSAKAISVTYDYLGAKNAGYAFNLRESERYLKLAEEALVSGDERYAEHCTEMSKKCFEDSESYYKIAVRLKPKMDKQLEILWFVLGVNAGILVVYITTVAVHKKRKTGEEKP